MTTGRVRKAPENFLDAPGIHRAAAEARQGRRDFLRGAFAAAAAGTASAVASGAQARGGAEGDPNILELPEHSAGLGQPVVTDGYGKPSKYEANVQRRQSPGLTQTRQASVSFAPLQSLFGIITPSGLHFERHHQGWWDIDPSKHRLMVNGAGAKSPKVFTMDDLMRLPSVSRFHFIECGANTGMEWGNVAVPTVPVHARHAVVQRVHRRAADHAAGDGRRRPEERQVRAGRRRRRLVDDAHHPHGAWCARARCWWPTARTARCCAPRTAIRCAWWCPACRASAGSSTCAASKWATSRTAPRTRRCTTST